MLLPALFIPVFFYVVNVGALQDFSEGQGIPGFDYKAFQLPVAIIFAVTGISRAKAPSSPTFSGYFDRLMLTPVRRLSLLLGLMVADFALVSALCVPVLGLGLATGVRFDTGPLGILAFILIAGFLGPGLHRLPPLDRAQDGQPRRRGVELHPLLPLRLPHHLHPAASPAHGLARAPWPASDPVTYVLAALRSLETEGWVADELAKGLLAIALVRHGQHVDVLRCPAGWAPSATADGAPRSATRPTVDTAEW